MLEHVGFLHRLGKVRRHQHSILARDSRGQFVKPGGGRIRRVRAQAEAAEPFGVFPEENARSFHKLFAGGPLADVDHLIEPPGPDGRRRQPAHQLRKGFDIQHRRRTPFAQLDEAALDRVEVILVIEGAF